MLNYLTLFTALMLSSTAIYYSVSGLVAIFAAYPISIMVMGTIIEVSKLVAVGWLHYNWNNAVWWLKMYLVSAVILIMFLTSVGIFGFLSKSHVEQTAQSQDNIAKIERLESDIARQKAIIERADEKIRSYETNGSGADASIQGQIDKEQSRIDSAYKRIQPQVDIQLSIIKGEEAKIADRIKVYESQISDIDSLLTDLQAAITSNNIKKAQGIIGANPDGRYGPKTAARVDAFRKAQDQKRNDALAAIEKIRDNNSTISTAQRTIDNLNATVKQEIDQSNALINRLRSQIGKAGDSNVGELIAKENVKITAANALLDTLTQEKFVFETQYRKLEAEVGPIKYIAEFVYGDTADQNLLEAAVRWVIIIIIFVFDPLAVLLLIASQYSFERAKEEKEQTTLDQVLEEEYKIEEQIENVQQSVDNLGSPEKEVIDEEIPEESITTPTIVEPIEEETTGGTPEPIIEIIEPEIEDSIDEKPQVTLTLDNPIDDLEYIVEVQTVQREVEEPKEEVIEKPVIEEVEEIDEPEPTVTSIEQLEDEEPKKDESSEMLKEILHHQHNLMDEITRRKQVTEAIRAKRG